MGDDLFLYILNSRYKNSIQTISRNFIDLPYSDSISVKKDRTPELIVRILDKLMGTQNVLIYLAKKARENDVLIHIGGSLYIDNNNPKTWLNEINFYKNLTIPYYIVGSNIGPIRSSAFLPKIRQIFKGAEDICLRDQVSYSLVSDMPNTRLSTDVVFSLDTSQYNIVSNKVVVFSLIDGTKRFSGPKVNIYEEEIKLMTERLIKEGYSVVYMSFCKHEGDEAVNQRVYDKLSANAKSKVDLYSYDGDLNTAMSIIASSEIVIASRFHASILGLVFGKKILPLAYSDKLIDVLRDINYKGQIIDIRNIESFNQEKINFQGLPITNVVAQKDIAEKQFLELDKILRKRNYE
jgi:colanic acid/amylovoran biosynthesis protein